MRHMPSPSPPRASGRRTKLAWPIGPAESDVGAAAPVIFAIEARTISRSSASVMPLLHHDVDLVDNPDDRGVHRRARLAERLARGAPLEDDQHFLVDAGADAVDR